MGRRGPLPGHGGRPPKPAERRRWLGGPGHRPIASANLVALGPVQVLPASPEPRSGEELIRRILATPAATWIGEVDRLALLPLLRSAWDEHSHWRAVALAADRPAPAVVTRLGQLEKSLTTWLSLLGLTPVDRRRLGVAEVKARTLLDELRARHMALQRPAPTSGEKLARSKGRRDEP